MKLRIIRSPIRIAVMTENLTGSDFRFFPILFPKISISWFPILDCNIDEVNISSGFITWGSVESETILFTILSFLGFLFYFVDLLWFWANLFDPFLAILLLI